LPLSSTVVRPSASACARIRLAAFSRTAARSYGVARLQPSNARAAASIARSQSAAAPNGTVSTMVSVAGFRTFQVAPLVASRHSPSISCL
jgi:hypothetical protein